MLPIAAHASLCLPLSRKVKIPILREAIVGTLPERRGTIEELGPVPFTHSMVRDFFGKCLTAHDSCWECDAWHALVDLSTCRKALFLPI